MNLKRNRPPKRKQHEPRTFYDLMYYVYVIMSKKTDNLYIGYSDNLRLRMQSHNKGLVQSTKMYRPWEIVYYESYKSRQDALEREKHLKGFGKAYGQLKKRIAKSLDLVMKGAG